jgi:peptidoglycan/LPS O-acetylase OafA/YrhL
VVPTSVLPPKNLLLESLRGLAAGLVLLFHLRLMGPLGWQDGMARYGWSGVVLFFALSGFLIAHSVLRPPVFDWRKYAISRSRRILPAYFANLLFLIVVANSKYLITPGWSGDLAIHVVLLHAWFGGGVIGSINGVYWTLSHEWSFYVYMGLTALLLRQRQWGWLVGMALLLVGFGTRYGWIRGVWTLPNGSEHPLCICAEFGFGVLAATLCHHLERTGKSIRPWVAGLCLGLGMVALVWGLYHYQSYMDKIPVEKLAWGKREDAIYKAFSNHRAWFLGGNFLISAGCGSVVLIGWLYGHRLDRWLKLTPLPWMGRVSYST